MPLITTDDIIETYTKLHQKGAAFWLSRFNPDPLKRTIGTFNEYEESGAYWWMIPAIRRRVNEKITGKGDEVYETYFSRTYLKDTAGLKMLSLGCGTCTHEMRFARQPHFAEVMCMDVAANVLQNAEAAAKKEGLQNMQFRVQDVNNLQMPSAHYDVVLFNSSLHHFRHVDSLLSATIKNTLRPGGLLLINEYVGANRLQFSAAQVRAMNQTLQAIPAAYRQRFKSKLIKNSISGPGYLRMLITDPSECVESESIMGALHKHYTVLEEKPIGGNLLMVVYKDIAHHFLNEKEETLAILQRTFDMEDEFLTNHPPDQLFGVYRKA